ncbi:hypothetical protein ACHHYP_13596 [Achlya hypogyna]|uniref:Uncharacterized protein n=1 Tax=Achlya hypogyna TaxID=1202772 RepID=A0A1V9ZFY3_ACHHY|nr:hypothetical protein ACHHYP_13596 [Achlya hypogyna]
MAPTASAPIALLATVHPRPLSSPPFAEFRAQEPTEGTVHIAHDDGKRRKKTKKKSKKKSKKKHKRSASTSSSSDSDTVRSVISGKKIKRKIELSALDKRNQQNRQNLLQFYNEMYD